MGPGATRIQAAEWEPPVWGGVQFQRGNGGNVGAPTSGGVRLVLSTIASIV